MSLNPTGSYAKVNTTARSWLSTPITKTVKGTKVKPPPDKIYPRFVEIADLCDDTNWKDIFMYAAEGKFPRNFSMNNNILYYLKKNKTIPLTIPEDNYQAMIECQNFFRLMGGVSTQDEMDTTMTNTTNSSNKETNEPLTWLTISSKDHRRFYIDRYVEKLKINYNLTTEEYRSLEKILNAAMVLEYFNVNNVVFVDKNITKIVGLTFDPKTRKFQFEPSDDIKKKLNKKKTTKPKVKGNILGELWVKYLNNYKTDKKLNSDKVI